MEKNTFDAAWIATLPAQVQTFLNGRNTKGDVYAYDWAYRLVDARYDVTNPLQEVQNPGSQTFVKNVAYTLDGLGNRSQVLTTPPTPPSTVTYAADVVNQYTAVGWVARTHDNNGNLKDDGTWVFSYDFEDRLVQVRQSGTLTLIADYHYDALGRRVEKVLAAGTTTRYLLDGVEVVEEYDAVGNWQARYVYEDGIDHPRCMDRADIADVNGNQNTTEVLRFHYHQQALGSVTEVTQPTGAVVEWVTYDVYGQPSIRDQQGNGIAQSAIGNPYLFTGREYDPEDGLYFYRARAYDPQTGRFLQRDPLACAESLCLYEYGQANPTTMLDPLGLRSLTPADSGYIDPESVPPEGDKVTFEVIVAVCAGSGAVEGGGATVTGHVVISLVARDNSGKTIWRRSRGFWPTNAAILGTEGYVRNDSGMPYSHTKHVSVSRGQILKAIKAINGNAGQYALLGRNCGRWVAEILDAMQVSLYTADGKVPPPAPLPPGVKPSPPRPYTNPLPPVYPAQWPRKIPGFVRNPGDDPHDSGRDATGHLRPKRPKREKIPPDVSLPPPSKPHSAPCPTEGEPSGTATGSGR